MGRREARVARKEAKRLKDAAKSARLIERPSEEGEIRLGADPGSIFHMQMKWTCGASDCDGVWSWGVPRQWSDSDWSETILPKLQTWANLTWGEIDRFASDSGHKLHHNMGTADICAEAQYRMIEIERYEDTIFRFRLGNLPRLWGFRTVAEFKVLWFDPTHKIYPVEH